MQKTNTKTVPVASLGVASPSAAGSWGYTFNGDIYVVTGGAIRGPYPIGTTR